MHSNYSQQMILIMISILALAVSIHANIDLTRLYDQHPIIKTAELGSSTIHEERSAMKVAARTPRRRCRTADCSRKSLKPRRRKLRRIRDLLQQFAAVFGTMQSNSQMIFFTTILVLVASIHAIDLTRLYDQHIKRELGLERKCEAFEPFRCPSDGRCISIQYLCDGAPDCSDGYDEDPRLCTAARRPPVEETTSFLNSLLASHGPNYLEKLFGPKARHRLRELGGVNTVAIALSESQTIEDFGETLHLDRSDVEHLRSVFMAVENGDIGMLKSLGIKDSELGDVKFFLEKLVNTGFLD